MSGNSFGRAFVLTSFGESHGAAIGGIIDGCPARIAIDSKEIQKELDRRKPARSAYVSSRREADEIHLFSGIFEGQTTGTPIGFVIQNCDQRSDDYAPFKAQFRPSHADYTYQEKYGIRDYRGGGRASARETAVRVAGGAIAKAVLQQLCAIKVRAYLSQIGCHRLAFESWQAVSSNPFSCPNQQQLSVIAQYLEDIQRRGDSVGTEITVVAEQVPAGLGEPVFDRLDADIAKALMSINAVKAVAIGDGFTSANQYGSIFRDERTARDGFLSNHAGGILGGISSGQTIVASAVFKPTSSIPIPAKSVDQNGDDCIISVRGRHDPCVGLRAVPIVEAMVSLTLCDHLLRQRGQNGQR